VTDYTTSVGSLAYSNIDQANMHQFPNTVTKNVITHNHQGCVSVIINHSTSQFISPRNVDHIFNIATSANIFIGAFMRHVLIGAVRISSNWYITNSNNTTSLNTSYVMCALPI
jgi:hypothetical protein